MHFPRTLGIPVPFPLVSFLLIHIFVYLVWLVWIGRRAWHPAWPVARTQLALFMLSLPAWGLAMACYMFSKRRASRHGYSLIGSMPRDNSFRRILAYFGLFLFGATIIATYPDQGDLRYLPDVRAPSIHSSGISEKVFIAAMFRNNEDVVPYWTKEILKVINFLRKENVFVSIVESNSVDNTGSLLRSFADTLNSMDVPHRIIVNDTAITKPFFNDTTPARIKFLAQVRNRALEPLVESGGYDRVLFSNDVFVEAESIIELLKTRDGDWDMVCGLDFGYWGLYDDWVIRDRFGRLVSTLWPYMFDDAGMRAISNNEPAEAFACWNGIAAFRADPLIPIHLRSNQLSKAPLPRPLPPSHPAYDYSSLPPSEQPQLLFRASTPDECFSSECYNLPYDLRRQFNLNKIYINPRVITAYEWKYYFWFKYVTRHWLIRAWIKNFEKGDGMQRAKTVLGDASKIWIYDGAECHPWENGKL